MYYDAIIIGARCAGAATALQLARGGKRVLVLDRHQPGADTMSTHALMRGAVMQLDRWGLLEAVIASGAPEITCTRFAYGEENIDVDIRPAYGTRALVAPRRYVLDKILADAAQEAGAQIFYGTSFADVLRDAQGRVTGVLYDGPGRRMQAYAPLVIGADGRRSSVARRVVAPVLQKATHTTTCIYAYVKGLPNRGYQWFYQPGLGAGAIPTHDGAHCIFVAARADRLRAAIHEIGAEAALRRFVSATNPAFGAALADAPMVSKPVVFGGEYGFLRQAYGPGWALVGDAGYFKDPLTAHGITDAFRDAELLSQAVLSGGSLETYAQMRDAHSVELFDLTNRIAALDWGLGELKEMHLKLNDVMKTEQSMIAGLHSPMPIAA